MEVRWGCGSQWVFAEVRRGSRRFVGVRGGRARGGVRRFVEVRSRSSRFVWLRSSKFAKGFRGSWRCVEDRGGSLQLQKFAEVRRGSWGVRGGSRKFVEVRGDLRRFAGLCGGSWRLAEVREGFWGLVKVCVGWLARRGSGRFVNVRGGSWRIESICGRQNFVVVHVGSRRFVEVCVGPFVAQVRRGSWKCSEALRL